MNYETGAWTKQNNVLKSSSSARFGWILNHNICGTGMSYKINLQRTKCCSNWITLMEVEVSWESRSGFGFY